MCILSDFRLVDCVLRISRAWRACLLVLWHIQRHMLHTSNISHVTLPNLRFFDFGGVSAYLEALLSHINAPLLKTLSINFFNQLSFPVSHLGRFVTSTENIRPSIVRLLFYHKAVVVFMYFSVGSPEHTLYLRVGCDHLDWQVSSMAQIFNILNPHQENGSFTFFVLFVLFHAF